jgi:hypothetical protein
VPAAKADQHDEQGADHEEVAGKAQAGLAGDEAKEPDQGKKDEDPAANPAQDEVLEDSHYFFLFSIIFSFHDKLFFPGWLSYGKNPQNLASKAGKRYRKRAG